MILNDESIPKILKDCYQWVVWRHEERDGKSTKVPYNPITNERASTTDPDTWTKFKRVLYFANNGHNYDGIGFVFSRDDEFCGIDLDHVVTDSTIQPWAKEIIDRLNSYTEYSPSGTGIHIYIQGHLSENSKNRKGQIEIYDRGRYFTVTGNHIRGTPLTVENRQAELDQLYNELFVHDSQSIREQKRTENPQAIVEGDDYALLDTARQSQNGEKFSSLFDRGDISDYNNDDSRADLALCELLAFWCGSDHDRIDRLFRRSALYRDKWDRADYRQATLEKAIAKAQETSRFRTHLDPVTAAKQGKPFALTELGNADRFVHYYGKFLRYCPDLKKWLVWDQCRWHVDNNLDVTGYAKETVRRLWNEVNAASDTGKKAELAKWADNSQKCNRINAMISLARDELAVTPRELDANPMLLNVHNGTIDLRNGTLLPHNPDDLITQKSPVSYDYNATLPLWDSFLDWVTQGDEQLKHFLQLAIGYSLTGKTSEEKLFFVHGPAATGKSTFEEAIKATLGDYAATADFDAFLQRPAGGIRNDIARLAGKRFVVSIEVDDGKKLAEALIKMITGGDTVTARSLYKEAVEFKPQFKLWLAANHAPRVRDDDTALWRRILRIPFEAVIPEKDRKKEVKEILTDPNQAGPAILAWAVKGCLLWQKQGLEIPDCIRAATESYREDMDPLKCFFDDCCLFDKDVWVTVKYLRSNYDQWAKENGIKWSLVPRAFNERIRAKGCTGISKRINGETTKCWKGIELIDNSSGDS